MDGAEHVRMRRTPAPALGFQELPWSAYNDCPQAPLPPLPPHSLPLQIALQATPPPSNPKFSGNSLNRPHHPFFLSPPPFSVWHPVQTAALSANSPLLPFLLPPDCRKCPQDCGSLSYSSLLQTDSKLANSPQFCCIPPAPPPFLPPPLSPGSKIFTAAAAVRSHGHETL